MRVGYTAWLAVLALGIVGAAQNVPDAPSAVVAQKAAVLSFSAAPARAVQKRRLPDAPSSSALTDGEKFGVFVSHAQSPLMFAGAGINAAMGPSQVPYGSRWNWPKTYTAALAERESNAFFGRYLFPALFDQDPRYHPSESGKFMPRAVYAASRVFVTRKDDGRRTLNTSYLLSTLLTSSLANVYKPRWDRNAANTFADVGSTIGGDAGFNLLREFWPQMREKLSSHAPKKLKKLGEKLSGDGDEGK